MKDGKLSADELLSKPEGSTFDRKSSETDINKLANILIAFANANGGTVAIGIRDKKFEGINKLAPQKVNDFLQIGSQLIKPNLKIEHKYISVKNMQDKEDKVLLLKVLPSNDSVHSNMKDEVYLRIGDETHKLLTKRE